MPALLQVVGDRQKALGGPGLFGVRGERVEDSRGNRGSGVAALRMAPACARGISTAGAPRKNMAVARCSAVCTVRSTPRISCARGMRDVVDELLAEVSEAGAKARRPRAPSSRRCACRRED